MTSTPLFANNAASILTLGITASATSVQLAPGTGSLFPQPSTGQFFAVTFLDALTQTVREIAYVTQMAGDTIAVMARGQEGTSALTWPAGSLCQALITAGCLAILGGSQTDIEPLPDDIGSVISVPFSAAGNSFFQGALTENTTFEISGGSTSVSQQIILAVQQSSEGGDTISFSENILWSGGATPAPSTDASIVNVFYIYTSSISGVYIGVYIGASTTPPPSGTLGFQFNIAGNYNLALL